MVSGWFVADVHCFLDGLLLMFVVVDWFVADLQWFFENLLLIFIVCGWFVLDFHGFGWFVLNLIAFDGLCRFPVLFGCVAFFCFFPAFGLLIVFEWVVVVVG